MRVGIGALALAVLTVHAGLAAETPAVVLAQGVDLDSLPAPAPAPDAPRPPSLPAPQSPPGSSGLDRDTSPAPARPTVVRPAPSPTPASGSARALAFVESYLTLWDAPNAQALAAMSRLYGPTVDFYGKPIGHDALLAQKRAYMQRWPIRYYVAHPGSVVADCDAGGSTCTVTGVVDWDCQSVERHAHAAGTAAFTMRISWSGQDGQIVAESGSVVARAPSP